MSQWIMDNWVTLASAFAAFIVFAKIVVKMTPSKTDDAVVDRLDSLEKTLADLFKKSPSIAPTEVIVKAQEVK